jgi:transcriptional regulator with XRE-family HTH domain
MESFGQRLTRLRDGRQWSQKELARRSGVAYMTIYRLEEGIYEDTRTATAAKLARTLGVSLDVLVGIYAATTQDGKAPTHVSD